MGPSVLPAVDVLLVVEDKSGEAFLAGTFLFLGLFLPFETVWARDGKSLLSRAPPPLFVIRVFDAYECDIVLFKYPLLSRVCTPTFLLYCLEATSTKFSAVSGNTIEFPGSWVGT